MICTNCGLCCIDYMVVIIKPESICETIEDFYKLTQDDFMGKESGNPCPYLYWTNGISQCKIHRFEWYKLTPCYDFTQIEESAHCVCRLGEYIDKTRPGYYEQYCKDFKESYLPVDKIGSMFMEKDNENKKT